MLLLTPALFSRRMFRLISAQGRSIHRDALLRRQLGLTQELQVGNNYRNYSSN